MSMRARATVSGVVRRCAAAVMLVATAGGLGAACAETMGTLAHDDRLTVHGLTQLEPDRLARALVADDELLFLSRPLANRKFFLSAVASKATLVLQRQGFAEARATARVERDSDGERVVVDVVEGPRQSAGAIEISGLPDELAQGLHRWLQSPRPPPGSVPQASDVEGGWSGVRWIDSRGLPAAMEPPAWSRGQPAAFDPHHLRIVRAAIARFLKDEGYFAAALLVDRQRPSRRAADAAAPAADAPACDVAIRPGADGATLAIEFRNLPPPAVLRGVEVLPGARTSAADVQQAIGIVPGGRVTERDRLAWREALRLTGRFIRHEVKLRELPPADEDAGAQGVVAVFDLADYSPATRLAEPLSRAERVMLACREWLLKTLADDDDLVVTWARAADDGPVGEPLGALVVSTRSGMLLTALPGNPDACGVAVSGDGLGCFLPRGGGRFEIPLPLRRRVAATVEVSLVETVDVGRHLYHRTVGATCAVEPLPRDADAALTVMARIEPVACLAFVHEGNPRLDWEGNDLVVTTPEAAVRFDAGTGRLLSLRLADGTTITLEAAPGRLTPDLARLREAAGDDVARCDAIVSSAIGFFTNETLASVLDRIVAAVDPAGSAAAWRERLGTIAAELRRAAAAGGFVAADRAVADVIDRVAERAAATTLAIPGAETAAVDDDPAAALTRTATVTAWRWTEKACGRDAWPAALARVAAYAVTRDSTVLSEVTAYLASSRHGPLAYLAAATAAPMPAVAAALARQGQQRLTAEAFHQDCRPLLAVLDECGLDRCVVAVLRIITDDEARRFGETLVQDPRFLLPLIQDLRGRKSDDAAVAALPEALDRWWKESLHEAVSSALDSRLGVQTADRPATPGQPAQVR
jgi:hypothetical protein